MAITYNNLYLDIRQQLHAAGLPAATLEARELVCCAAGKSREELTRDSRLYVPDTVERQARQLVERHLAGEPVAYLIGEWEFYGLPLDISERVLIPRPDTEVLAAAVIEGLRGAESPGCWICAPAPAASVWRWRKRPRQPCGAGGDRRGRAARLPPEHSPHRPFRSGGVHAAQRAGKAPKRLGEFDCIVSNPPYIPDGDIAGLDPSVRDYEPHLALKGGVDGLDFYRAICDGWRTALRPGGRLYFEVGIGQADDVLRIMRAVGFGDIEVLPDLNGIPRVVWGILHTEL